MSRPARLYCGTPYGAAAGAASPRPGGQGRSGSRVSQTWTPEYADIRYTGHEKGDFLFVPPGVRVEVAGGEPPAAAAYREALFWQSIQASQGPADFAAGDAGYCRGSGPGP